MNDVVTELEILREEVATLRAQNARLKKLYDEVCRELVLLKRQLFGQKSERVDARQTQLAFDLVMDALAQIAAGDEAGVENAEAGLAQLRAAAAAAAGPKKKKKGHGRGRLSLEDLPIERVVIEPAETKLEGAERLVKVGEDVSEHLDRRPASLVRVQVVRPKYIDPDAKPAAAEASEEPLRTTTFVQASVPERPLPKSNAGPGLLAHVLVSKYGDHIPLHRQESIFKREGLRIARSTLVDWVRGSTALLEHIVDAMWDDARAQPYVLSDATGVLVQAREQCKRAHFYVVVVPNRCVLYSFTHKNDGESVKSILSGFSGKIQVDAASVYHELFRQNPTLIEVGCWAHARRKFFNALDSDRERALTGIGFIGLLYDAHKASMQNGIVNGERRREACAPILEKLEQWLKAQAAPKPATSPIEEAINYILNQWVPLTRFRDDGNVRLDNNPAELELRREVVGRKNWLFVGSDSGAAWNVTAVSLIASCALHDIEPWAYLRDVLTLLPAWNRQRVIELAPHRWKHTLEQPQTQTLLRDLRLWQRDGDAHANDDDATEPPSS